MELEIWSVAFTKEASTETAAEAQLSDCPIPPHPNLVTEVGLKSLERQPHAATEAYDAA